MTEQRVVTFPRSVVARSGRRGEPAEVASMWAAELSSCRRSCSPWLIPKSKYAIAQGGGAALLHYCILVMGAVRENDAFMRLLMYWWAVGYGWGAA